MPPHSKAALSRGKGSSFLTYARSPMFWFACALYFVAATPFEQDRSGFSFLIRLSCILFLLAPLVLTQKAKLLSTHPVIILVFVALVAANISAPNDRLFIALALVSATATLGQVRDQKWLEQLSFILFVYLSVNAAGLALQVAALRGAGILLDLHGLIFPNAARIEIMGEYGRLSGFHNEPGTYSQWMLMTLFLRSLITRRLLTSFNLGVCGTIVATVSLWGFLGVCIFLLAATIETLLASRTSTLIKRLGALALLTLAAAAVATVFVPGAILRESIAFLQAKAGLTTESGLDKLLATAELQRVFQDVLIIGAPMTPGFCPDCRAPNDAGIWANGTYYLGFTVMLALGAALGLRVVRLWGPAYLPLLAILLTWKAAFYDPALWMLIGHILASAPVRASARQRPLLRGHRGVV